jgi:hypothetical protein
MAFPSSNLSLTTVASAYNINPKSLNGLRGLSYYDGPPGYAGTVIPPVGVTFSLSALFGKYPYNTNSLTQQVTTTTISLPAGRNTPTGFSLSLVGGGGGGGGGGGRYNDGITNNGGGNGGGGGGAASLTTNILPYVSSAFSTISISLPTAGNGGGGGFGGLNTADGSNGSNGTSATVIYNGVTYSAGAGGGGFGGYRGLINRNGGQSAQGSGGTPTSINVASSVSGTGAADLQTGGVNGGGAGGGGESSGSAGAAGSISITWYFT